MEEVCNHMNDYSLYVDPETKEKLYKRFAPRDGDPDKSMLGNLQHFQFGDGPDSSKSLKFAVRMSIYFLVFGLRPLILY